MTHCFANGQPIIPNPRMLYDSAEAIFNTSASSPASVTGSSLIVPIGKWAITYSIEMNAEGVYANLCGAQFWNQTDSVEIGSFRETIFDQYGFCGHAGVYYVELAAQKEFRWRAWRAGGTGNVYVQRARILAMEDI